jgi:MFS family permease
MHSRGPAPNQPGEGRAFGALRHRDFQLFWSGGVVSQVAGWMQQIAQSWLVYDLTGSALLVGLNGIFQSVPFVLISFYSGTVVDRVDRKKLLIWLSWGNGLVSLVLAVLIVVGHIALWHIYAAGLLNGIMGAFENPARQSLLPHLVPRADMMTAVSLNSIQRKGAQVIGPALGGIFLAGFGTAGSYFVRAATFAFVILTLWLISGSNPVSNRIREPALRAIVEGLRYVRAERILGGLILMDATMSVFGSYNAMMVIFAREVFNVGPVEQGILQGAAGLGSVLASLALAAAGDVKRKGFLAMTGGIIYACALLAFAFTPWFWLAVPLLTLIGFMDVAYGAIRQTVIQLVTKDEMLGRVTSLAGISQRGLGSLSGFPAGVLTTALGSVQLATAIGAGISLALILGIGARVPILWRFTTKEEPGVGADSSPVVIS